MKRALAFDSGAADLTVPRAQGPAPGSADAARPLRIVLATPLGAGGRGGMDRLADLVIDEITSGPHATFFTITRLTTKGGHGRLWAVPVFAAAAMRLLWLLLRHKVDLLHLNLAADGSFTRKAMLANLARHFGIPYVVHIHTGRFANFWNGVTPRRAARIDCLMRNAARIVVLGDVFADMVAGHVPEAAAKTVVVPNATPTRTRTVVDTPGQPARITFLGVLCAAKGVPELIEALGRIGSSLPWTATLAGYGAIEDSRTRAAELNIADRISTPGWLSPHGVDALLAVTDILVLPSFSEGLPMTVIEGFAAGIPVIATPVGATPDVVKDGFNGLLIPPGDIARLTEALTRLIADPALRRRLGSAAAADHERLYQPGPYVSKLVDLWREAALPGP